MRRACLLTVFLACALAPSAQGHYNTARLGYRSTIRDVKPPMPGLKFKIEFGDDQILLDNHSKKTVVVKGYDGEPYIRVSPNGVYVNLNSPSGYLNQDRYARVTVPKSASAKARPKWERLISGHTWAWHDHRIHYMSPIPPPQIKDEPRKPHHVFDWKVPATENGKRFVIEGSLDYKPPPKPGSSLGLVITLATLVGVGLIGLFALRRVLIRSLSKGEPSG